MEIMTIESNAYRLLVEKIEKITAYVEESRNREETERKRKEEAESPATKGRKADPKGNAQTTARRTAFKHTIEKKEDRIFRSFVLMIYICN